MNLIGAPFKVQDSRSVVLLESWVSVKTFAYGGLSLRSALFPYRTIFCGMFASSRAHCIFAKVHAQQRYLSTRSWL